MLLIKARQAIMAKAITKYAIFFTDTVIPSTLLFARFTRTFQYALTLTT